MFNTFGINFPVTPNPKLEKMKKLIIIIFAVTLASCKNTRNTQNTGAPADRFVIENLTAHSSNDLKRIYADANIKEDVGMFDEGTEERAYTILFPDTEDELHITWDNAGKTRLHDIRYTEKGKWKSNTGIKVGTTYEELNRLNGKEISFYGFGWDYSGAVVWNDGKFENSNIFVFLEGNSIPGDFYGDHIIEATPEEITSMNLKVNTILYKK